MTERSRIDVLVVDDDKAQRDLLHRILSLYQLNVSLAESGADALRQLEQSTPDLILLDIQMPEMDGYETLKRIHEKLEADTPTVIGLSGSIERGDEQQHGFSDYIVKPFTVAQLGERLKPFVDIVPLSRK